MAHGFNADVNYLIKNNTITFTEGVAAIAWGSSSTTTTSSVINAVIADHTVGVAATNDSGSRLGFGIVLDMRGNEVACVTLDSNTLNHTEVGGIRVIATGNAAGDGDLAVQITNNVILSIDDNGGGGFGVLYGIEVTQNNTTAYDYCVDMRNNDSSNVNTRDSRVRQGSAANTFQLEGFGGTGTSAASVEAFLATQNPGNTTNVRTGGSVVMYTSGSCTTPAPTGPIEAEPAGGASAVNQTIESSGNRNIEAAIASDTNSSNNDVKRELTAIAALEHRGFYQRPEWVARYVGLQSYDLSNQQTYLPPASNFNTLFAVYNSDHVSNLNLRPVSHPVITAFQKQSPNSPQSGETVTVQVSTPAIGGYGQTPSFTTAAYQGNISPLLFQQVAYSPQDQRRERQAERPQDKPQKKRGASGVAGADPLQDEYIELYNTTAAPITVASSDGTAGWTLVKNDGAASLVFTIPNGTMIPATGHYLIANSNGYSLGAIAAADGTYATDIANGAGLALLKTTNPAALTVAIGWMRRALAV